MTFDFDKEGFDSDADFEANYEAKTNQNHADNVTKISGGTLSNIWRYSKPISGCEARFSGRASQRQFPDF